jgi:hypothetical protein
VIVVLVLGGMAIGVAAAVVMQMDMRVLGQDPHVWISSALK